MWQRITELPYEVGGIAVFSFLSVKDLVRMERALVSSTERETLFNFVRRGPPLTLELRGNHMYDWLCRNDLTTGYISLDTDWNKYRHLHERIERASMDCKSFAELPDDPRLCNKIDTLAVNEVIPAINTGSSLGSRFHKIQRLTTKLANCTEAWMWELLDANPSLRDLQLDIEENELPPNWFDEVAKRCGNLQVIGLRAFRRSPNSDAQVDEVLSKLPQHCPALRSLFVTPRSTITTPLPEGLIVAIAQECRLLERVLMMGPLAASIVSAVCEKCRNLTALVIAQSSISFADLQHLLPQHRKQFVTELACCWALQHESEVQACAKLFSGLRVLRVAVPAQCERAFAAAAPYLAEIETLSIALGVDGQPACAPEEVLLAVSQTCRNLREFEFAGTVSDDSRLVDIIAGNRYLMFFSWQNGGSKGCDGVVHALGRHCPLLESVVAAGISDDGVHALVAGCKHLSNIRFNNSSIADSALRVIGQHCRGLEFVRFDRCENITEAGLMRLVECCPTIVILVVTLTGLDQAAAQRIKGSSRSGRLHVFCW
jgi:hypothetical protein